MIKRIYACYLQVIEKCFGVQNAKKIDLFFRFHEKINLRNPSTLSDKICWLSLNGNLDLFAYCTDKWGVRKYVEDKGLGDILVPVYGSPVDSVSDISLNEYPEQFVLKATHGCKMNYVCLDKRNLDADHFKNVVQGWLNTTYGTYSVEPHYRGIPHRVYCEKYLGESQTLFDYKIFCYNGYPQYIMICSERERTEENKRSEVALSLYDTHWNLIPEITTWKGHYPSEKTIGRPKSLDNMLKIAEILSADFDFVRVDLYEVNGKIYFGELTFTPANGVLPSFTRKFKEKEGAKLKITQ